MPHDARPRTSRLSKLHRRQDLVQAAFRRIAERGFEGLRTRDVAADAGVNIATLHYYFPTKEALIRAVIGHAMTQFRSTLAPGGSSEDQPAHHIRAVRTLMREQPELGTVMGELALRSARDPGLARIMRQTQDAWHRIVRALLRRAATDGTLAPELDSDDAAALIIASLMSMALPSIPASRSDQAMRELDRWLSRPIRRNPIRRGR
jgi:AcrR family transcriptional regulator